LAENLKQPKRCVICEEDIPYSDRPGPLRFWEPVYCYECWCLVDKRVKEINAAYRFKYFYKTLKNVFKNRRM
jgi:hypothetical protein